MVNFSQAKDVGDAIAIAYDFYISLGSEVSFCSEDVLSDDLEEKLRAAKSISSFSFLDTDYRLCLEPKEKAHFLSSLFVACDRFGPFDQLALQKHGTLSSFFLDQFLVLPMGGERLSCYIASKKNLRDIADKAKVEEAFAYYKIVPLKNCLFRPNFLAFDFAENNPFYSWETSATCIRFWACPFFHDTLETFFTLDFNAEEKEFTIGGPKADSPYETRYQEALANAITKETDFILFPEMALADCTLKKAKKILAASSLPAHTLIVAGSWWHDRKNTAYLLDGKGQEIMTQDKFSSFLYPKKDEGRSYREGNSNVQLENPLISVVEVKGLGRMGLLICKDSLERNLLGNFTSCLSLDLLIIIAYSPSRDIERNLASVAQECHTSVVLLNACFGRKQQVKFFLPFLRGTLSSFRKRSFKRCKKRNCLKCCSGREGQIDI